jgi:putative glutamine amidotransferase
VPLILVTSSSEGKARPYIDSVTRRGGTVRVAVPSAGFDVEQALSSVGGLLLTGGEDVHPRFYGQGIDPAAGVEADQARDEMEFALLRSALAADMPVLAICRGMQLLNVTFGGSLLQDIPGHRSETENRKQPPAAVHPVFVAPGSKLGAIIGGGAVYHRVNSQHHQGLKDPQKATALLASGYMPEDGIIEALESPVHSWVIGVQCHPEREDEVPSGFLNLFDGLLDRAEDFASSTPASRGSP